MISLLYNGLYDILGIFFETQLNILFENGVVELSNLPLFLSLPAVGTSAKLLQKKKQKKVRRPLNFCFKGLYWYKVVPAKTTANLDEVKAAPYLKLFSSFRRAF